MCTTRPERWGAASKKSEALIPLEEKTRASGAITLNVEAPTLDMIEASSNHLCLMFSQVGKSLKDTK